MTAKEHDPKNQLLKNIERVFLKIGLDQNFLKASRKHLNVMHDYFFKRENIHTRNELCNTFLSKLFMDKLDMYPCKRQNACQVDEHFDCNFKICPSEMFGEKKLSEEYRLKCFFDCLKTADILDCRVAEILDTEYRLRVIVKYGSPRLLCDLNITVLLPQNQLETSLLKHPLKIGEFVRVVVENEHATLDKRKLPTSKQNIKLGRIDVNTDLPFYVFKPPSSCATLLEYLTTQPILTYKESINFVVTKSGLDEKKHYSYYPSIDSIKDSNESIGQVMLEEAETKDVENFINLALAEQKNANFQKALEAIDEALKISKNSKIYVIRSTLHADLEKSHLCKRVLLDLEMAYQLDKNSVIVRQSLSQALTAAAIKLYKSKMYQKAVIATEKALFLNEKNKDASALVEYIKNKYYSKSSNNDQQMSERQQMVEVDLKKVKKEGIDKQQEENVSMLKDCNLDK